VSLRSKCWLFISRNAAYRFNWTFAFISWCSLFLLFNFYFR